MEKKIAINVLMIMVSLLMMFSVSAQTLSSSSTTLLSSSDIRVSMLNQEPDPVEPGKYVKVRFMIENWGSSSTPSLAVGIKSSYPFTLVDEENEKIISSLQSRQIAGNARILEWTFLIDKDAPDGPSDIILYYRQVSGRDASVIYDKEFQVQVRTSDTILEVVNITTTPELVVPGQVSNFKLSLKNLGDNFIKDVKVNLDLTNTDIATIGSTSQKIIGKIDGKQSIDVSFDILPSSAVSIGVQKIPLTLEFKDNLNNVYTHSSTFGLVVNSPVTYIVNVDSNQIFTKGQQGDITVKISNTGMNNMQYTIAELKPSTHYTVLSSSQVYIGEVQSDDFETVSFKIFANDTDSFNNMNLRLFLTYRDNFNKEYFDEQEIPIRLYSSKEIKQYGLIQSGNGGFLFILILIILAASGYFYYQRRKKKKLQNLKK